VPVLGFVEETDSECSETEGEVVLSPDDILEAFFFAFNFEESDCGQLRGGRFLGSVPLTGLVKFPSLIRVALISHLYDINRWKRNRGRSGSQGVAVQLKSSPEAVQLL